MVRDFASGLFEKAVWYWLKHGLASGHVASLLFDPAQYYLEVNVDVQREVGRSNYLGGLLHHMVFGRQESRISSPVFDAQWYAAQHQLSGTDAAIDHFLKVGLPSGTDDSLI